MAMSRKENKEQFFLVHKWPWNDFQTADVYLIQNSKVSKFVKKIVRLGSILDRVAINIENTASRNKQEIDYIFSAPCHETTLEPDNHKRDQRSYLSIISRFLQLGIQGSGGVQAVF